jgi:hypothetical protein
LVGATAISWGKEILIKSVAQAVPTFSMSCFKLPRGLCEHINSLLCKFWWGCKEGQRKMCWVSWEQMTQPKSVGGLGFRDIELFNLSLLARQAWRLLQVPESLSARVLRAVYFPSGDILSAELGSHPSQIWRSILEGRNTLNIGLIRRIGDGRTTQAWSQNWLPRDTRLRPFTAKAEDAPVLVSYFINHVVAAWDVPKLMSSFYRWMPRSFAPFLCPIECKVISRRGTLIALESFLSGHATERWLR